MDINKFLDILGITRTELSIGLGMENPSSFGRYKNFDDLKKIRNMEYKDRLSFLFDINKIEVDSIDVEGILRDDKNIAKFKERLEILKSYSDKRQKLNNLEINNKKLLYQNVSILEDIAIEQQEDIANSLRIFLEMMRHNDEKIKIFLLYLGKMNMEVDINKYHYSETMQKELEALFFVILNDKLRTEEISNKLDISAIYRKFEERVEIRKELFEERNINE